MSEILIRVSDHDDAPSVLVEVHDSGESATGQHDGPERAGLARQVATAGAAVSTQVAALAVNTLNQSLDPIGEMADAVLAKMKTLKQRPSEVEVTMGFKFGSKGDLKMVTANADAHLQVKLTWTNTPADPK